MILGALGIEVPPLIRNAQVLQKPACSNTQVSVVLLSTAAQTGQSTAGAVSQAALCHPQLSLKGAIAILQLQSVNFCIHPCSRFSICAVGELPGSAG